MESTWYLKDTKQVAKPQRASEFSGARSCQVLNWQRKPTCLLLALSRVAKAKLSSVFPLPFHMQQFVFYCGMQKLMAKKAGHFIFEATTKFVQKKV